MSEGQDRWQPWTAEGKPSYTIRRAAARPELRGLWDSPAWQSAEELRVDQWLEGAVEGVSSSPHRPDTRARLLYDDAGVYVFFRVNDRYVRAVANQYRGRVWEDACAEFFVQPKAERGYFNLEMNCGGTMLLSYHENPAWTGETLRKDGGVPWELARRVAVYHSMPVIVHPEVAEDVVWQLEYFIPREVFEAYLGPLGDFSGQAWRANFYKCAETGSHPHWGTWSPVLENMDFHQPKYFGIVRFE